MAKGRSDVLQLLANPTNRAILSILSVEPQYPRRLAEIVGLTEDEASRRLRAFATLGLAEAEWANVGKTVRLYRLASTNLTVQVTPNGLTVAGLPGAKRIELEPAREEPPTQSRFVGRDEELANLASLLEARKALCVHGIGGVGKTSLAAKFAAGAGRPVAWHTVAPAETSSLLLGRLAANQRALEMRSERAQRLLNLTASDDAQLLLSTVIESVNALGALVVLDRFEVAGEGAGEVVAKLAQGLTNGRLLVTSRSFPKELPRDHVGAFTLSGLARDDAERLVHDLGSRLSRDGVAALYDRTRGHALSLVLAALASGNQPDLPVARLVEESGIRDFLMSSVLPQLSEAERDALLALSVLRDPFTAEEAEAVTDSRHAVNALLRLEGRSLVARSGHTYQLHDLVRAFAQEALGQRKSVHARAAKILRASGQPVKVLEAIHHHLEAGMGKEGLDLVRQEATQRTFRFADHGLSPRYREVLLRLSLQPTMEPLGRAAVELELGNLDILAGEAESADRHLQGAESALRGKRDPLAIRLLHARAKLLFLEGKMEDAARLYAEGETAAEKAGDREALVEMLVDHAFCEEQISDPRALAVYEKAMSMGDATTDARCLSLIYSGAARITARNGDKRFLPWTDEAMRLARLAGYLRGEVSVYMTLTTHTLITGDIERGEEFAERYLALARRLGDPWLTCCALGDKAYMLVTQKRYDEARPLAEEFLQLAKQVNSEFYVTHASTCLAESLLARGEAQAAHDLLLPAIERNVQAWPAMGIRARIVLAQVLDALGHRAQATTRRREARQILAAAKLEGWQLKWFDVGDDDGGEASAPPAPGAMPAAKPKRSRQAHRSGVRRPRGKGGRA